MLSQWLAASLSAAPKAGQSKAGAPHEPAKPIIYRVMVLDFKNTTKFAPMGEQVAEIVRITVPDYKKFEVIDRGIMDVNFRKRNLNANTVIDTGTALPAAKDLKADYMIVGSIGKLGESFSINIRLVATENGQVVKAAGVEFTDTLIVRRVIRDLLTQILSDGKFTGRPILTEAEYDKRKKSTGIALTISLSSVVLQAAALGGTLTLSDKNNPNRIWTSSALLLPSFTPIYTEDWLYAPYIIGGSVMSGVFNFVGFALVDAVPNKEANFKDGDSFKKDLGGGLIVLAGLIKLGAVVLDLVRAHKAVDEYNRRLAKRYYISYNRNHNGYGQMQFAALTNF